MKYLHHFYTIRGEKLTGCWEMETVFSGLCRVSSLVLRNITWNFGRLLRILNGRMKQTFACWYQSYSLSRSSAEHQKELCFWGTSVEILAFSSLFQVDVFVASDSYHPGQATWIKYSPRTSPTLLAVELSGSPLGSYLSLHKDWIEILHVSQSHFDAVKPIMGNNLQRQILNEISDVEKLCLWAIAYRR